jgi:hypothetical protein
MLVEWSETSHSRSRKLPTAASPGDSAPILAGRAPWRELMPQGEGEMVLRVIHDSGLKNIHHRSPFCLCYHRYAPLVRQLFKISQSPRILWNFSAKSARFLSYFRDLYHISLTNNSIGNHQSLIKIIKLTSPLHFTSSVSCTVHCWFYFISKLNCILQNLAR